MLIAVEGIDGSGKSTLARTLAHELALQGHGAQLIDKHLRRPIRSTYSELCKGAAEFPSALSSLFLALSDFAWTADRHPADRSALALWDRYLYSALADAFALGVSPVLLAQLCALFPPSAVTILVSVPARIALQRKASISLAEAGGPDFVERHGSLERAFLAFQDRVNEGYLHLAESHALGERVLVVDGTLSAVELHRRAMAALSASYMAPSASRPQ